mgnify:CR=1 FL=1
MRILIVEDEIDLQTALESLIKASFPQSEIEAVSNIDETISWMKSQQLNPNFGFDLILADVSLQGEYTGFDLWKICSEMYPNTHFVFMSGISTQEFMEKLKDDPKCPPFLSKPFTAKQVKELLKRVMDSR